MERLKDFYTGKKVFLTGGTGFKGSWLCLLLHELKATVYDYSMAPPSEPSLWQLADVAKVCTHIRANILDKDNLKKHILKIQPDICIHLAAQSLVRPSYSEPYETLEANIMGTASVLEAVRTCPSIKSTLCVTSDKAYENIGKPHPYKEQDRMGGDDPYSASKGAAELIIHAYRHSFFDISKQGIASVRAGNVIGGGDFATDRLIPDMAKSFKDNVLVNIRYPQATRPWQHVLDPLYGYLLLAKELYYAPQKYSEGWNFGPLHNEAHTVKEVVQNFSCLWDNTSSDMQRFTISEEKHPHEAAFLGLDCHKAHTRLQWVPRLNFMQSLAWTAQWYKAWSQDSAKTKDMCTKHITDFLWKKYELS